MTHPWIASRRPRHTYRVTGRGVVERRRDDEGPSGPAPWRPSPLTPRSHALRLVETVPADDAGYRVVPHALNRRLDALTEDEEAARSPLGPTGYVARRLSGPPPSSRA